MNLMSLNAWFVIVAIFFYVVISKYNNRLGEAYLADQLVCVLNTNSSCWDESDSSIRDFWNRDIVNWQRERLNSADRASDGKIIRAIYYGVLDEKRRRILRKLGGHEVGDKFEFERVAHPRNLGIHARGFRYLLNEGYQPNE